MTRRQHANKLLQKYGAKAVFGGIDLGAYTNKVLAGTSVISTRNEAEL